jgi:hypothetical protein
MLYFCSKKQQVTDIKGHTLVSHEDKSKGKFAFTTDDYEVYEICFVSKVPPSKHSTFKYILAINDISSCRS